jgi:hypothetical protein
MTLASPQTSTNVTVRPVQYRDLDELARLTETNAGTEESGNLVDLGRQIRQIRRWYKPFRVLSIFPNPLQHFFGTYVAEQAGRLCGLIQVSPFNRTRSTWRVDHVIVGEPLATANPEQPLSMDIGSQLLRYCFQNIWEARTWLIEVDVNDKSTLALYRHNGFQTLAKMTYWEIAPEQLEGLAEREPDLPNLLPISNADSSLLHQLDTVSMPPLVRQVFDRHVIDFKTNLFGSMMGSLKRWMSHTDVVSGYVFEPQRKAAIGYFRVSLNRRDNTKPHSAQLTVHPAYTWLYPELLAQMAQATKDYPSQPLHLVSADYQPEREEYLEQIGATRIEHTLMMSRSVWHKLRESKFVSLEGLQLSEVLQGLQPSRKPVPGRFSLHPPLENRNGATKTPPADRSEDS